MLGGEGERGKKTPLRACYFRNTRGFTARAIATNSRFNRSPRFLYPRRDDKDRVSVSKSGLINEELMIESGIGKVTPPSNAEISARCMVERGAHTHVYVCASCHAWTRNGAWHGRALKTRTAIFDARYTLIAVVASAPSFFYSGALLFR